MDLNNIQRNQLDYVLTDVLPTELSDRFTYSYFYQFLIEHEDQINKIRRNLEKSKAKGKEVFAGKMWSSIPLKYPIMKGHNSEREISLLQPMAAFQLSLFVGLYEKEILSLLEKNSCFSLRYHHRNNNLVYKNKNKSVTNYFYHESTKVGREVIEQTGMYYDIVPYRSIAAFTSSEEWYYLNSKYTYFTRSDYKACFDSIYTHTFTWIIGKDTLDTIEFKNSNVYSVIDRVLQNVNGKRTNGIVVGPEFSRMIAELMLQNIDDTVKRKLFNMGYESGTDYDIYRYVDDLFIFSTTESIADVIVKMYTETARKFLLRLNEAKLRRNKIPFILNSWLNEAKDFTNRMCATLFASQAERDSYSIKTRILHPEKEEEIPHIFKARSFNNSKPTIMRQFNDLICNNESTEKTLVSYFLGAIFNHIKTNKEKALIFNKNVNEKTVFSFLDLVSIPCSGYR